MAVGSRPVLTLRSLRQNRKVRVDERRVRDRKRETEGERSTEREEERDTREKGNQKMKSYHTSGSAGCEDEAEQASWLPRRSEYAVGKRYHLCQQRARGEITLTKKSTDDCSQARAPRSSGLPCNCRAPSGLPCTPCEATREGTPSDRRPQSSSRDRQTTLSRIVQG